MPLIVLRIIPSYEKGLLHWDLPGAAVPFLVLAGHGAQWRDLNWLFCIFCTIIKNCEVYTRYHWERRITLE